MSIDASSQKIPLKKMVSFLGHNGDKLTDYLQLLGFEFDSQEYAFRDSTIENLYFVDTRKSHRFTVKINAQAPHSVYSIEYQFADKNEYSNLLSVLLSGGFIKVGISSGPHWIEEKFSFPINSSLGSTAYISLTNDKLLSKYKFAPYALFIDFDEKL